MGFCVYVPLPPLRGQHTVLCHPRGLPTSGLTEFAVCWGGAGLSAGEELEHRVRNIVNSRYSVHCKNSMARLPPKHGSDAVAIESVWY